jgi:hypothetical protein
MQAFNGDHLLGEEFIRLRDRFAIKTVIETGTHCGYTTRWLAAHFDNVITVEIREKFFAQATENLSGYSNVSMKKGDSSRDLLPLLKRAEGPLLVYLDAHWYANPLVKELEQIKAAGMRPVLVIHDFKVPDRPEFGYDAYPKDGIVYEWDWIKDRIADIYGDFDYYYNREATGTQRGCVFVVPR